MTPSVFRASMWRGSGHRRAMTQMAKGDPDAEVTGETATDEIGEMARTLAVFGKA
jgi:HAMP domain-containing protein